MVATGSVTLTDTADPIIRSGYEAMVWWSLYVEAPVPDPTLRRHMSKRIGDLINANLRYTYGQ